MKPSITTQATPLQQQSILSIELDIKNFLQPARHIKEEKAFLESNKDAFNRRYSFDDNGGGYKGL